jgi:hypothetical protein
MLYPIREVTYEEKDRAESSKLEDRNGLLSCHSKGSKRANHGHQEEAQEEGTGKCEGLFLRLTS